jgi:hypothetical protein
MKDSTKKIIMILVILAIAFYWFEWRPAEIRANCANEFAVYIPDSARSISDQVQLYNGTYERCLETNGI